VLYAVAPELRNTIEEAGRAALFATLDRSDEITGFSRRGKAGAERVKASLAHAIFFHVTSRAEDPQLHWHCLLMNIGVRKDGTTGALYSKPIYETKIEFGKFFQERLAAELENRLGLKIVKEKVGFHIEGVPRELCDTLSKRRQEIKRFLKQHGKAGGKAAKEAAIRTRGKKKHTKLDELTKLWQEVANAHGFGPAAVKAVLGHGQKQNSENREEQKKRPSAGETQSSRKTAKPEQSRAHRRTKKLFERELQETVDRIFPENQNRPRITRIAFAIAYKHGLGKEEALQGLNSLKLPTHRRLYRIEWRPLFPKTPIAGLKKLRAPRVVLRNRPRRWGKIRRRKVVLPSLTGNLTIQIQERKLFPSAPAWNPLSKISLPAIRIRKQKTIPPVRTEELRQRKHLAH
jgi:hypothetical protein